MLTTLSNALAPPSHHLEEAPRELERRLEEVDRRLKGTDDGKHRRKAIACDRGRKPSRKR